MFSGGTGIVATPLDPGQVDSRKTKHLNTDIVCPKTTELPCPGGLVAMLVQVARGRSKLQTTEKVILMV